MVTNINLVAPKTETKAGMSGKMSLIISAVLLLLAIIIYLVLNLLARNYQSQQTSVENQITQAKSKMTGADFADVADFQGRVYLLNSMLGDRVHFDSYLSNMSKYVLPEVHFTNLDWKNIDGSIEIKGFAPNFNSLSQAIILLKQDPDLQSIEFKNAAETAGSSSDSSPAGVQFDLSATLKPAALNK